MAFKQRGGSSVATRVATLVLPVAAANPTTRQP